MDEGVDVEIGWDDARAANLANWNDRVPVHEVGYELHRYDDPAYLSDVVTDDLPLLNSFLPNGTLAGLDLCHLQCHIGTDTVSLARAGARVTGVDFSEPALTVAAQLAERTGTDATWVHSDVLDARSAVTGDFDVVYTSIGTICWLEDLTRWATQIAGLLRAGGTFYIRDTHPVMLTIDETAPDLRVRYRYFPNGTALSWDEVETYLGEGTITHTRTYEWPHPLPEIINALIAAGLRILRLDEGRTLPWQYSTRMVQDRPERWSWPGEERDRVPCTFTLVARRD